MTPGRPQPEPLQSVWTEADFESMSWHDVVVHAFAVEPQPEDPGRLLIDLDYIVEWIPPPDAGGAFTFAIAPATLVFDHAWDLMIDVDLHATSLELQLNAITRSTEQSFGRRTWTLEGHNFTLAVTSGGFRQNLRSAPIRTEGQVLAMAARGGISFSEKAYTA